MLTKQTKIKYSEEVNDFYMPQTNLPIKYVEMNDEWETYLVKFSIFWPLDRDTEELALETDKTGMQVLRMQRSKDIS